MPRRTATEQEIVDRFAHHPPTDVTKPQHETVRATFTKLALQLQRILPDGRHKSLALTDLQSSMHWANTAIACDSGTAAGEPTPAPTKKTAAKRTAKKTAAKRTTKKWASPRGRAAKPAPASAPERRVTRRGRQTASSG